MRRKRFFKVIPVLLVALLLSSITGWAEVIPFEDDVQQEATDYAVEADQELLEAEPVEAVLAESEEALPEAQEQDAAVTDAEAVVEGIPDATAQENQGAPVEDAAAQTDVSVADVPVEANSVPTETVEVNPAEAEKADGEVTVSDEGTDMKLLAEASTASMPATLRLGTRERFALGVTAPNGGAVTYKSSKAKVAAVDAQGVVTAKKKGSSVITAVADGAEIGRCKVTVVGAPKKAKLSTKKLVLNSGATCPLTVTLTKKTASQITWTSTDGSVASVGADGVVTAGAPGSAVITAATYNGKKAYCNVTVISGSAPTGISLNAGAVTLGARESFQVVPQVDAGAGTVFTYSVKNKKIASVSQNGVIKGKKAGRTTVTVSTHNGLKASVSVTVRKAPSKITLSPKALTLQVSQTAAVKPALSKKSASAIQYSTDNAGVATVDAGGVVTAVGAGTATITARTFNGKTARCTVTVGAPAPAATPAPTLSPILEPEIDVSLDHESLKTCEVHENALGIEKNRRSDDYEIYVCIGGKKTKGEDAHAIMFNFQLLDRDTRKVIDSAHVFSPNIMVGQLWNSRECEVTFHNVPKGKYIVYITDDL